MQKYVKQHFYGADFRTTSLPSYKDACVFSSEDNNRTHLTEQHGKAVPFNFALHEKDLCQKTDSEMSGIVQNGSVIASNELSPSHLSTHVNSRETTASNIKQKLSTNAPGESEKATLFMFHGVGGSADVFKAQIEYFTSQGHEVIAPDLIGHGYSPAPKKKSEYMFKDILLDIYIIFDMYCKQHNIVIGHSYG